MKIHLKGLSTSILILFVCINTLNANISLPEIFSDNMVIQQRSEVKFWGWAKAGETVTLKGSWDNKEYSVKASTQGKWQIIVSTPESGGPFNIYLKGYNEVIIKNVLVGEVWLCSGQSNMEWTALSGINNAEEEIKNANHPNIRLFTVFNATSGYPQDHFTGKWSECTPETMAGFSAIGYFFARRLNSELEVPVGIINSSWGGTPAESWMPVEVIQNDNFLKEAAAKQKPVPWGPVEPGRIYNSMIAPMIPFRIAGVLWYQGEANTINAYAYKQLLSGLIKAWRSAWEYEFPFYFAQIAPYKYGNPNEGTEVRDAQRRALEVPNTGMVVISDIGDTTNIHPRNKQDVGLRFANMALKRCYNITEIEDSGPLFKGMTIDRNKAIITFNHAEGLKATKGNPDCFEIAGPDNIYYPARARIKDQTVVVQSDKVKVPVNVRFAWSNTATPGLFNSTGLPASCFITDN